MRGIKLVEPAILHGDGGDASAPNVSVLNLITDDCFNLHLSFVICHFFSGLSISNWILRTELYNRRKQYTSDIYFISRRSHRQRAQRVDKSHQKRCEIVTATRRKTHKSSSSIPVSEDFSPKSFRYHPGLFKINKWSCCRNVSRTALGCLVATNWPERNNNYKSEYTRFDFLSRISSSTSQIGRQQRKEFSSAVMSFFLCNALCANLFHCWGCAIATNIQSCCC